MTLLVAPKAAWRCASVVSIAATLLLLCCSASAFDGVRSELNAGHVHGNEISSAGRDNDAFRYQLAPPSLTWLLRTATFSVAEVSAPVLLWNGSAMVPAAYTEVFATLSTDSQHNCSVRPAYVCPLILNPFATSDSNGLVRVRVFTVAAFGAGNITVSLSVFSFLGGSNSVALQFFSGFSDASAYCSLDSATEYLVAIADLCAHYNSSADCAGGALCAWVAGTNVCLANSMYSASPRFCAAPCTQGINTGSLFSLRAAPEPVAGRITVQVVPRTALNSSALCAFVQSLLNTSCVQVYTNQSFSAGFSLGLSPRVVCPDRIVLDSAVFGAATYTVLVGCEQATVFLDNRIASPLVENTLIGIGALAGALLLFIALPYLLACLRHRCVGRPMPSEPRRVAGAQHLALLRAAWPRVWRPALLLDWRGRSAGVQGGPAAAAHVARAQLVLLVCVVLGALSLALLAVDLQVQPTLYVQSTFRGTAQWLYTQTDILRYPSSLALHAALLLLCAAALLLAGAFTVLRSGRPTFPGHRPAPLPALLCFGQSDVADARAAGYDASASGAADVAAASDPAAVLFDRRAFVRWHRVAPVAEPVRPAGGLVPGGKQRWAYVAVFQPALSADERLAQLQLLAAARGHRDRGSHQVLRVRSCPDAADLHVDSVRRLIPYGGAIPRLTRALTVLGLVLVTLAALVALFIFVFIEIFGSLMEVEFSAVPSQLPFSRVALEAVVLASSVTMVVVTTGLSHLAHLVKDFLCPLSLATAQAVGGVLVGTISLLTSLLMPLAVYTSSFAIVQLLGMETLLGQCGEAVLAPTLASYILLYVTRTACQQVLLLPASSVLLFALGSAIRGLEHPKSPALDARALPGYGEWAGQLMALCGTAVLLCVLSPLLTAFSAATALLLGAVTSLRALVFRPRPTTAAQARAVRLAAGLVLLLTVPLAGLGVLCGVLAMPGAVRLVGAFVSVPAASHAPSLDALPRWLLWFGVAGTAAGLLLVPLAVFGRLRCGCGAPDGVGSAASGVASGRSTALAVPLLDSAADGAGDGTDTELCPYAFVRHA